MSEGPRAQASALVARAVFVAAESRGLGDLMSAFFEKVDPDARDLYS
jgi:hypothetical protein